MIRRNQKRRASVFVAVSILLLTSSARLPSAERTRSPIKIPVQVLLSATLDLDVRLSTNEFNVLPGEVFEVVLKITNGSSRAIVARVGHVVEPYQVADFLDFVECGFLFPVTLMPGEQEYSGRYVVRSAIPDTVRQLNISYDFRPLK